MTSSCSRGNSWTTEPSLERPKRLGRARSEGGRARAPPGAQPRWARLHPEGLPAPLRDVLPERGPGARAPGLRPADLLAERAAGAGRARSRVERALARRVP